MPPFYVVDRIEGETAVVVSDDGHSFDIERSALPDRSREGTVLRVECTPPDWSEAVIDDAERQRRLDCAEETLRSLAKNDPGGDVKL
jgi:hypothetical protein